MLNTEDVDFSEKDDYGNDKNIAAFMFLLKASSAYCGAYGVK